MSSAPTLLPPLRSPPIRSQMTEAEFVDWCDDQTWAEWVDGEVIMMNAVAIEHGDFVSFLYHLIRSWVDEHELGKVLGEPCQVRFQNQRRRRLPDLFFVSTSRMHLLEKQQCNGAPDLIVEIVSPESQSRDRREKFLEYEAAGVMEYWLVDPQSRAFEAYGPGLDGKYKLLPVVNGSVFSKVLPGLFFRPEWVWQLKFPKVAGLIKQMKRPKTTVVTKAPSRRTKSTSRKPSTPKR